MHRAEQVALGQQPRLARAELGQLVAILLVELIPRCAKSRAAAGALDYYILMTRTGMSSTKSIATKLPKFGTRKPGLLAERNLLGPVHGAYGDFAMIKEIYFRRTSRSRSIGAAYRFENLEEAQVFMTFSADMQQVMRELENRRNAINGRFAVFSRRRTLPFNAGNVGAQGTFLELAAALATPVCGYRWPRARAA